MEQLSQIVMEYTCLEGAFKAGIATTESLAGGPESTDLTYVLPGARSAVVFALAMDPGPIPDYLGKVDRRGYEKEYNTVNSISSGIAVKLCNFLKQRGHKAAALAANDDYREDTPHGAFDMMPPVSLRYLAVASGVASFGLSGNAIDAEHGAAIILGAVVTDADLIPTAPLPLESNYCDDCRLCIRACASRLMVPDELTEITMGGRSFTYAARQAYSRCQYVCGGYTGLAPSGKWSTWSPGRFPLPERDDDFLPLLLASLGPYSQRPAGPGGRYHSLMNDKLYTTCGNCQIVCAPDREERKRRYKLLTQGGVVVQNPDGGLEAVTPEEAEKRLAAMPPETRAIYDGELDLTPELRSMAEHLLNTARQES
jgi:epoxyqueuosine reductase QueG